MDKKESNIICELNLNDFKYLSVRFLFFNWFFSVGAEVANQLLDNIIKLYLKSINCYNIIKEIKGWGGNESHNVVRIIELCIKKLNLDFDLNNHKNILSNIYTTYQCRYLENLEKIGEVSGSLNDIDTIDYAYKYFRDKINISEGAKNERLINKIFLKRQDLLWGEYNISLSAILFRGNKTFLLS